MTFNQIIKKVPIGNFVKGGKDIPVFVATQTSEWIRPDAVAVQQGPDFLKALEGGGKAFGGLE